MSAQFVTTQWSQVLAARDGSDTRAQKALAGLCDAYWLPLYAFVRRSGHDAEESRDLTQAFFTRIVETGGFASADPERGRFRSYLLGALKHFLANEWHREQAQKRGGLISYSWEAVINNDVNGFSDQMMSSGEAAQATLDNDVWALLLLNQIVGASGPVMGDTNQLFSAAHSNVIATALDLDGMRPALLKRDPLKPEPGCPAQGEQWRPCHGKDSPGRGWSKPRAHPSLSPVGCPRTRHYSMSIYST